MASGLGEFMVKLRMAAVNAVSEDDMRVVFQKLTERAKSGDLAAIKLLCSLVLPPAPTTPPIAIQVNNTGASRQRRKTVSCTTDDKVPLLEQKAAKGRPLFRPGDRPRDEGED